MITQCQGLVQTGTALPTVDYRIPLLTLQASLTETRFLNLYRENSRRDKVHVSSYEALTSKVKAKTYTIERRRVGVI